MDEKLYDDLALALLYHMFWKEKSTPEGYSLSWKGFDFDSLDRLRDSGLLSGNPRNKSVTITPEGRERALGIIHRLDEAFGEDSDDF